MGRRKTEVLQYLDSTPLPIQCPESIEVDKYVCYLVVETESVPVFVKNVRNKVT